MRIALDNRLLKKIALFISFAGLFLYLGVFNRYHLSYLEQIQLFRYNEGYLAEFFLKPGGLIALMGSFLTQFFYFPWFGALILTLVVFMVCVLTDFILRRLGLHGILFSLLPSVLLAAMHSNHNYPLSFTLGWILSLAFFAVFICISDDKIRFWAGLAGFVLMYVFAGLFSFLTLVLCVLYEMLSRKGIRRFYFLMAAIPLSIIVPLMSWKYIYLITFNQAWFLPVPLSSVAPVKIFFYSLLLYYPLVILLSFSGQLIFKKPAFTFSWNWKYMVSGTLLFLLAVFMLITLAYDRNNELFLSIDANYHSSSWEKVLTLSDKYPGQNQLVMYYTNLALFKSGDLANTMFHYKQSGTKGLWLKWERNETAPFFGGEVFYHLGYTNEAFRWAFEAMEAKGLNPRSLKRLVVTSIINRNYKIAGKYLNYLDQTLLYRKWASDYRRLITDTTLIYQQKELAEKRKFLPKHDFIADINPNSIGLDKLLDDHPDNRMAYEYLMASFLLRKDLDSFAANIYRLKDIGYKKIPQHFEEALVLYAGLSKRNVVPDGYIISNATRERFYNYAKLFAANRYDMNKAGQILYRKFGDTFWFYMQFAAPGPEPANTNL
jgi:hypothetical protein